MIDHEIDEMSGLASPKWRIASVDRATLASAGEATLDRDTAKQAVENAGFDLRSFARVSED